MGPVCHPFRGDRVVQEDQEILGSLCFRDFLDYPLFREVLVFRVYARKNYQKNNQCCYRTTKMKNWNQKMMN
jgi:hypothetical protein